MFIESFETSKTAVYGDLLGGRRQDKELKVGFLAGAYFEYYRMWGEGFAEQIRADMDLVAANLRKRFKNVVYPGMCDTMDKCARAGEIFRQEARSGQNSGYRCWPIWVAKCSKSSRQCSRSV